MAARPLFVVRASLHLALLPRGVRRGVGGIGIGGASGQPPRSTSLSASLSHFEGKTNRSRKTHFNWPRKEEAKAASKRTRSQ